MQDTSLDAWRNLENLGLMQQTVYDVISKLGCPTDLEIAKFLGYSDPNKVRPRRNDLVKMGFVIQHEKRVCSVSGHLVYSWRVA